MKLFAFGKDGGPESHVWGYWLIEWKRLFSVALLRFEDGSREAYHEHAFNAISWLLSGTLVEHHEDGRVVEYRPSIWPIYTERTTFHKVESEGRSWVFTLRGPWTKSWRERIADKYQTLTEGRKVVNDGLL